MSLVQTAGNKMAALTLMFCDNIQNVFLFCFLFLTNTKTEPQVNETEKGYRQVGGNKTKTQLLCLFF